MSKIFSKTLPLVDFLVSLGASKMQTNRFPSGKRSFKVLGTDVSGRVAENVPIELSMELSVSWFTPDKPDAKGNLGEPSWMLHTTNNDLVECTFST
jgi:hypothetical protein